MPDQESIVLDVDPRSVLTAIKQANQAVEGWEKQTIGSGDKMQKSLERMADMLLKMNDRSRSSMERLTQSIEKQAAAYGKTGVDRLIADRDRIIKKLGDEQGMIDRVTASYAKMIDVESGKSGGSFQALGRNIEGFLRDPLNASKEAATGLLEKIGPMGGSLAIGATALAAVATAGWEAAKSLGEYGVRVKDAELRTGLTAKEVGQFSFAAKAVGQDISLVERMMRGLTNALTENTSEGEKARTTLRSLGVSTRDELGNLRPTSEILQELGEGLNRLPDAIDRNRAAMDIFKRAGIEAVPMITELTENLRIAREQGFGPTEDDIRRFTEYQRDVAELETKWDGLMRKFKEGLVTTLSVSIKWIGAGVKWFLDNVGTAGDDERARQEEEEARQIWAAGGIGAKESLSAHRKQQADMERQAPEIMRNRDATLKRMEALRGQEQQLTGDFGILQAIAPTEDELARMKKADQIHKEIDSLQQLLNAAGKATRRTELKQGKQYIDGLRGQFFATHDGLEQAYQQAKKDVEKYRKELFEGDPEKPLTKSEATDIGKSLAAAQRNEARLKGALDLEQERKKFTTEASAFTKKGDEADLSAIEKIYYQRDLLLKQATQVKASEAEIAAIRKSADEQASVISKKAWEEFEKYDQKQAADRAHKMAMLMMPSKQQMKEWEEGFAAQERIEDIGVQAQREELRRRAARSGRMAELTAGQETPMAMSEAEKRERSARKEQTAAQQAYQVRVDLAVQLAGIEAVRISKEENAAKRAVLAAQAQKGLYTDLAQAQDQFEEKRAQIAQKRVQELQQEIDGLQKVSSGLFHTLFTKPQEFGKQLAGTIREAVLKPITEGLGGMVAGAIHPLIYGSDGHGGIAGVFKGIFGAGKQDPIKAATDLNTAVTAQNSMAIASLTAVFAAAMGMGAPAIAAPTGIPGGISLPAISIPAAGGSSVSGGAGGTGPGASIPISIGGAASPGASGVPPADIFNLPITHSGFNMNPLGMILGASQKGGTSGVYSLFSKDGLSKTLQNLKGTVWNQKVFDDAGGGLSGGVQGVAKSPAAGAAGMMLAMNGLFGSQRGTWGGIAESTAGGALIGEQIGGPLGAAIGAGAGFLAGVGEKVFGVESPENEAKRLVKQLYSISIDNSMAKQIAGIAQQKYAGHVSIAVRDPDVRKMLMLYSESTGQKMPLSATTPQSGSLAEMGGKLYQQATYVNGTPYTFQSNLPVAGGYSTGTYPAPGPMTLQVNVAGQGAAQFVAGQVVTPEFVQSQWSSAASASNGRLQNSAIIQQPGLVIA
jgi:hypothetical protein